MTEDEIIKVVQAYKNGQCIQYQNQYDLIWKNKSGQPIWDFSTYNYRVQEEPRIFWAFRSKASSNFCIQTSKPSQTWYELIKLKEVIE